MKRIIIKAALQFHGMAGSYKPLDPHSFSSSCQEKKSSD